MILELCEQELRKAFDGVELLADLSALKIVPAVQS
jgi:hypothetical protein